MKIRSIRLCALIITVSCLSGCSFCETLVGTEYGIYMRNDTDKRIIVWGTYNQTLGTGLPEERPAGELIVPSADLDISPFEFIMVQGHDWTKSLSDTDTIRVFVFDSEKYEETDWSAIRDQYLILRRYDFTQADLDILGWHIAYPPSSEMKDIKMWPSYEE